MLLRSGGRGYMASFWIRGILLVFGLVVMLYGTSYSDVLIVIGLSMNLVGCYLWVRDKNRAKWWALFAFLWFIGWVILALLSDKSDEAI